MSLLIIDDDADLCSMLQAYLGGYGLQVRAAHDAHEGLMALMEGTFDLVILDVMLPILDGFSLLRKLRETSCVRVIMLTARANEEDRISGFDAGADDYLTKPFSPRELVGRIHAILRRAPHSERGEISSFDMGDTYRGIRVNVTTRQAYYLQHRLQLTETEFLLLRMFIEAPGAVISREELFVRVFRREFHPLDRSLDMHISRLRRKLEAIGCISEPIKTIRSSGYMLSE